MANNCLVTKLKGSVNNPDLLKIGEILINCSTTRNGGSTTENQRKLWLQFSSDVTISAEGNTFSYDGQSYTSYTGVAGKADTPFIFPDGEYNIHIEDAKYQLFSINNGVNNTTGNFFLLDLSLLDYSSIRGFNVGGMTNLVGELKANVDEAINLRLSWGGKGGMNTFDVSRLSDNSVLVSVSGDADFTKFYGTINDLHMTTLTNIIASNPELQGEVKTLAGNMVTAGRTSGTLTITHFAGGITYDGNPLTQEYIREQSGGGNSTTIWIDFDSSYPNGYNVRFTNP